jgi:hypothetical protein
VKQLKRLGTAYTSTIIADTLQAKLLDMGVPEALFSISVDLVDPTMRDKDPQTIFIHYTSLFGPNPYISVTRIMIGAITMSMVLEGHTQMLIKFG